MANTISLADLINQPLPTVGTQLNVAQQPTGREVMAEGLSSAAGELGQKGNLTPLTALIAGIAGGAAQGIKNSEAKKRDEKLDALRAQITQQQEAAAQAEAIKTKLANAQAADQLMTMNGKVVGNVLQTLELGDAQPVVNFVKSNPEVANLLGDDGPGGMEISNVIMDTDPKDGTKHIRAVWQNPDGTEVRGRPISFDGLLQRYAPDVYDARTQQQLDAAKVRTEQAQGDKYAAETEKTRNSMGADGEYSTKPLPAAPLKLQDEATTALSQFNGLNSDIDALIRMIDRGDLNTGILSRGAAAVRTNLNASTASDRNLSTLDSKLQSMRNAILLLNKGVQTEGDAQRAMDEIINNRNDTALVRKRLEDLKVQNERAATLQTARIDSIRNEYNKPPADYGKYDNQPNTVTGGQGLQGNPQAEAIKAAFKAGTITREQAKAQLQALGVR